MTLNLGKGWPRLEAAGLEADQGGGAFGQRGEELEPDGSLRMCLLSRLLLLLLLLMLLLLLLLLMLLAQRHPLSSGFALQWARRLLGAKQIKLFR